MSSEQNKTLVRRFVDEVWNRKSTENLDEFLSPSYTLQTPDGLLRGPKEFRQYHENYVKAFPDCKITLDEIIAEGDTVVTRATFTGTQTGEFRGIAPTGKRVSLRGMSVMKIVNGKCTEGNQIMDRLGLYEQLGVAPEAIQKLTRHAGVR